MWNLIQKQINNGKTASIACDDIYAAFGQNLSITQIITAIKRAKARNEMPPFLLNRPVLRTETGKAIPVPRPFPRVLLTEPLDPNRGGTGVSV